MSESNAPNGHDRFIEAQRLAEGGLGRCHGPCRKVKTLSELVTVMFRDTVVTSLCPDCFEAVDLIISMKPEGLDLKIIKKSAVILVG